MAATLSTSVRRYRGNTGFRDEIHSPAVGSSMWENCPILSYMQDPSIGHLYMNHFHTYNEYISIYR